MTSFNEADIFFTRNRPKHLTAFFVICIVIGFFFVNLFFAKQEIWRIIVALAFIAIACLSPIIAGAYTFSRYLAWRSSKKPIKNI